MTEIEKLLEIMQTLRTPNRGCPWDLEQTFETIAPYTIEEAYEVADAIARGDMRGLEAELGDLLLQVVFHARMAEEAGHFDFADVASGIVRKMIRRHPHVFGDELTRAAGSVAGSWERIKAEERGDPASSALDGIARALPALRRTQKIGQRASHIGFDWPDRSGPRAKIDEELAELEEATRDGDARQVAEELGDLLFAIVNLARHLDVDAETALAAANDKFERRFREMERAVRQRGADLAAMDIDALEREWQAAKRRSD